MQELRSCRDQKLPFFFMIQVHISCGTLSFMSVTSKAGFKWTSGAFLSVKWSRKVPLSVSIQLVSAMPFTLRGTLMQPSLPSS